MFVAAVRASGGPGHGHVLPVVLAVGGLAGREAVDLKDAVPDQAQAEHGAAQQHVTSERGLRDVLDDERHPRPGQEVTHPRDVVAVLGADSRLAESSFGGDRERLAGRRGPDEVEAAEPLHAETLDPFALKGERVGGLAGPVHSSHVESGVVQTH